MRPGREVDVRIAQEVFGHSVWVKNKVLHERRPSGDRPLRNYSKELEWAFEVAAQMKIMVLPVVGDEWFAFVGPGEKQGWESPQDALQFLVSGQFEGCGAAVGAKLPLVICQAALRAVEKRVATAEQTQVEGAGPLTVVSSEDDVVLEPSPASRLN